MEKKPNRERIDRFDDRSAKSKITFGLIFAAVVVAVFFFFNFITNGKFLGFHEGMMNMRIILGGSIYPMFLAWAMCFILGSGYMDLSWGAILVLVAYSMNIFGNAYGLGAAIIAALLTGSILVFVNFCIFALVKVPAWIASLSLAYVYESIGLYLYVMPGTKVYVDVAFRTDLRFLGRLPWSFVIMIAGLIIVYFLYERTTIGLNIRAIGSDARVAKALGINVSKTAISVGIICGILVGVGGFLFQSYEVFTTARSGIMSVGVLFQPLAIAQMSNILRRRIHIIIAVPICAFLLFSVFNIMTLLRVPTGTLQETVLALALVGFAIIGQRGIKEVVQ